MGEELLEQCKKAGLEPNFSKTKYMSNTTHKSILLFDNIIERVQEYTYLGQIIAFADKTDKEISRRIEGTWRNFWALKHFYKSKKLSIRAKIKILEACTIPSLLYGAQTWSLMQTQLKRLQTTQRRMERSILNIKLKDKISIKKIRERSKAKDVGYLAKRLKFKYVGHLSRTSDGRWSKAIMEWTPSTENRRQGRPTNRYIDEIRKRVGIAWRRVTEDRQRWMRTGEVYAQLWAV